MLTIFVRPFWTSKKIHRRNRILERPFFNQKLKKIFFCTFKDLIKHFIKKFDSFYYTSKKNSQNCPFFYAWWPCLLSWNNYNYVLKEDILQRGLGGLPWRRVLCEQPLHTSQSILSPRRNPMSMTAYDTRVSSCRRRTQTGGETPPGLALMLGTRALSPTTHARRVKGNPVLIPELGTAYNSGPHKSVRRGNPNDLETPSWDPGRVFFSV